jgi:hypothetical protein
MNQVCADHYLTPSTFCRGTSLNDVACQLIAFGKAFQASANLSESTNTMDRWILASLQNLIAFVHAEMAAYRLYTVTPKLLDFIEQLTNWYIHLLIVWSIPVTHMIW